MIDRLHKILYSLGLTALSVFATVICIFAWFAKIEATEAKNKALGRQLTTEADSLSESSSSNRFTQSTLLALEAQKRLKENNASTSGAQKVLHNLLSKPIAATRVFDSGKLMLSVDGEILGILDGNKVTLQSLETLKSIPLPTKEILKFHLLDGQAIGILSASSQLLGDIELNTDAASQPKEAWVLYYLDSDERYATLGDERYATFEDSSVRLLDLESKQELKLPVDNVSTISLGFDDRYVIINPSSN